MIRYLPRMTLVKWIQFISVLLLALVPFGIEIRNSHFPDKRFKKRKIFTRVLVTVWLIAIIGFAGTTFIELSKKEKIPKLAVVLNDVPVRNNSYVVFPVTNLTQQFVFDLFNDGTLMADEIQLTATFPNNVVVLDAPGWTRTPEVFKNTNQVTFKDNSVSYSVRATMPIAVSNNLIFSPLTVGITNIVHSYNSLLIKVAGKNFSTEKTTVWFFFTNGVGRPYISTY